MKYLALAIAVLLAVFTVLAMAGAPSFVFTELASAGPISIYPFDLLLGAGVLALLAVNAFVFTPDPVPLNRLMVWLCVAYVGYQFFVVLPAAVLLHGLRPIDVIRDQEVRLALLLVLVVYSVVLRYWRPAILVAIIDVAAAALALWVITSYFTSGPSGYWQDGTYRLREGWGGSSLLFGWLFFTSLFYWRFRWWRLTLALLALGSIVLTNHRSAFVALLAAFVVQMVCAGRLTRRVVVTVVVVAVIGAGVYYGTPSVRASVGYSVATMFNANADLNAQDRVVRSALGLAYFEQHPLGDYIWNQRYYLDNVYYDFAPHNFIVQRLVTQGIVASLLFFAVLFLAALIGWQNRRDQLTSVMLAYMTFYLVFCLFNTNIDSLENQGLIAAAIGLILYQNRRIWGERNARAHAEELRKDLVAAT